MADKNLTRKKIANKIFKTLGFSKNMSLQLVDDFFELIISELVKLRKIKITAFGTLEVVDKKERIGRNPKTKIIAKINARRVVRFKSSKQINDKLNQL